MNIFNYRLNTAALFVLLLLTAITGKSALAAGTVTLTSTAVQEVVETDSAGNRQVRRVPLRNVVPGDEVIYVLVFENTGTDPADNIVIENPVPEHTRYKDGSATGSDTVITYSIDKGKRFDTPEKLLVTEANGATRPARPREYTNIRWRYKKTLPIGEKSFVDYHVVIQ